MKNIIIEYKLIGDEQWRAKELTPADFFDESEGGYSVFDSTYRYFLEPRKYIDANQSDILLMIIRIADLQGNSSISKFTFWNMGLNQIKDYREYVNGILQYKTLIFGMSLGDEIGRELVLRVDDINDFLIPITNNIINGEGIFERKFDLTAFKPFLES